MALNYVQLTLDIFDGSGGIPQAGTVTFTPSAVLSDTTDHQAVQQGPVQAVFNGTAAPVVRLLATDNAVLTPSGWGWTVTFSGMRSSYGIAYNPVPFSFFLPFSAGASQFFSSQQPVVAVATLAGVTPLTAFGQQQLFTQRSGPLTPFIAALANRQFARCNIVCVGDSITEGQHAQLPPYGFLNRWVSQLPKLLRQRFPVPLQGGGGRGFMGIVSTGETSFSWPVTLAGSPPNVANAGPKGQGIQFNTTGQTATFSMVGDAADIMWMQVFSGGTVSWAVDGGTPTNIPTAGGSTADGQLTRISLGAPGPHNLVLAWVSGASNFDGVVEYYGDASAGISVHDAGHFGAQTSSWVTYTASGTARAIAALAPALIIITLGVNDQFSGVTPAVFGQNLQTIISQLKAQLTAPFPSFVLQMLPPRAGQAGFTFPWSQYVAQAWGIAASDTSGPAGQSLVTVLDYTMGPRLPGADVDVYGIWQAGDNVHPSDKGHQAIADALCQFLTQG